MSPARGGLWGEEMPVAQVPAKAALRDQGWHVEGLQGPEIWEGEGQLAGQGPRSMSGFGMWGQLPPGGPSCPSMQPRPAPLDTLTWSVL